MTPTAKICIDAFKTLQDEICVGLEALEALEGEGKFIEDQWNRQGGGGGRTRVIKGDLIEKGGVNFSAVHGTLSEQAGEALATGPGDFLATGVSIVLHPKSPMVPIIHMNVRYFEMEGGVWWFGGGIDLTPHYVMPALATDFHERLKAVCDAHSCGDYAKFKATADDYFYLKHRKETRGIGGIFYDRLTEPSFEALLAYSLDVGQTFVPAYTHQVERTRNIAFDESHESWQRLRRGRYVEFNLVWDRGTKFGLETDGRTESILMSMPPQADWVYDHKVDIGSQEADTLQWLRKGVDWV